MTIGRFILRYKGEGTIPIEDSERIRQLKDINILDSTSRMLLVEASSDELERLVHSMPQWILVPEQYVGVPDPRPQIKKNSGSGNN